MIKGMTDIKKKKAVLDRAAWMNQSPNPLPVFRKGEVVQVYRGAGWSKGKVISSTSKGCMVNLFQGDNTINVYDARCIRKAGDANDQESD